MKSRQSIFFMPPPPVRIFTVLALLVFAVSVMSGGCVGSSTSSVSSPQSANDTISGAWHYDSGTVTANVNGQSVKMTVLNFAVLFESCDIERDTGSAVFTAVAPLQGEHFMLPMLFEKMAITTTRNGLGSWTADTEHGRFTIELLDDDRTRLTGSVNWYGGDSVSANVDVVISKLPSTEATIDINTALNGEWQTKLLSGDNGTLRTEGGGGYFFHDGNLTPLVSTFMNASFSDTNIQAGTTTMSGMGVQGAILLSGDVPKYDAEHYVFNGEKLTISHMFRNVYMISNADYDAAYNSSLKLVVILENENRMYIITQAYAIYDEAVEENRCLLLLNKTTGVDTVDIRGYVGSSWETVFSVLDVYDVYEDDDNNKGLTLLDVELSSFDISFPSADIKNKTVTLSAHGMITSPAGMIPVDYPAVPLSVNNLGYNAWFGEAENGDIFSVIMITDKLVITAGYIGYSREDWYEVDLLAVMQRVDPE